MSPLALLRQQWSNATSSGADDIKRPPLPPGNTEGGGCPFMSKAANHKAQEEQDKLDSENLTSNVPPPLFGRKKVILLYEQYIHLPALKKVSFQIRLSDDIKLRSQLCYINKNTVRCGIRLSQRNHSWSLASLQLVMEWNSVSFYSPIF